MIDNKWTFTNKWEPYPESNDGELVTYFTNGSITLSSNDEEFDEEQLVYFCELLNDLPDLFTNIEWAKEYNGTQEWTYDVDYILNSDAEDEYDGEWYCSFTNGFITLKSISLGNNHDLLDEVIYYFNEMPSIFFDIEMSGVDFAS